MKFSTITYKNAERYKRILENLERKLSHVKFTCGSGFIHDARQNHSSVEYLLEEVSRYVNLNEMVETMFDYDNIVNGHPKQFGYSTYQEQTESAFDRRFSDCIEKAENFLKKYASN